MKKKVVKKKPRDPNRAYGRPLRDLGPEHPMYVLIGKNIKFIRKQLGMTQPDLAERLDVSYQAILRFEKAINYLKVFKLARIAKIFGVSMDVLCTRDIEKELGMQKFEADDFVQPPDPEQMSWEIHGRTRILNIEEDAYYTRIGERIREIREKRGMTQAAVAEAIGVHTITLLRTESAIHHFTVHNLLKTCEFFGISLDSVARLEGSD